MVVPGLQEKKILDEGVGIAVSKGSGSMICDGGFVEDDVKVNQPNGAGDINVFIVVAWGKVLWDRVHILGYLRVDHSHEANLHDRKVLLSEKNPQTLI
ncbi:hypothetical protein L6452_03717 [Arctium lappa]|uniref:Uncharacterized protein n=1 Tax=Arctium lappa TaxID=4217 RepID=A0ACB9FN10_ARCLA|nr:hypothetical protein L6452_03717 [Arctium lappa]